MSVQHKQSTAPLTNGVEFSLMEVKHGEPQLTTSPCVKSFTARILDCIQYLFSTFYHHEFSVKFKQGSFTLFSCLLSPAVPHKAEGSQRLGAGSVHAAITNSDDRRVYLATLGRTMAPREYPSDEASQLSRVLSRRTQVAAALSLTCMSINDFLSTSLAVNPIIFMCSQY
jgi:hypothetical protein